MKKIFSLFMLIVLTISLTSCINNITYDELLLQYQQDIEARHEIYDSYIEMYDVLSTQTIKSIVKVSNTVQSPSKTAVGSGFIFYEDDTLLYVLTNHHVIDLNGGSLQTITVTDYLGKNRTGTIVAADESYDLAVVSFSKTGANLDVLQFSQQNLKFMDRIIVMGYPDGQINGISLGEFIEFDKVEIISSTYTSLINFPVLTIDAPVESGSSGSVVLNKNYEIAGIIYAGRFKDGSSTSDFAYAVAVTHIKEFLELYEVVFNNEVSS